MEDKSNVSFVSQNNSIKSQTASKGDVVPVDNQPDLPNGFIKSEDMKILLEVW